MPARVAERGLNDADVPAYPREREYLVLARHTPNRALAILDRLHDLAVAGERFGSAIQIGALRALALDEMSDPSRALDALVDTLTLAQPEGCVRVFADEGSPMLALLRHVVVATQRRQMTVPSSAVLEHAARLLSVAPTDQADSTISGIRIAGATVVVEPLTERESEVLLLLAEGRSNQEIAERLVVTPATVTKHLTHIFGKLDAVSRTRAVARARELRLLDETPVQRLGDRRSPPRRPIR